MTERVADPVVGIVAPDISQLVTEDDNPVDNIPSAKQQRLLVEPLYSARKIEQRKNVTEPNKHTSALNKNMPALSDWRRSSKR